MKKIRITSQALFFVLFLLLFLFNQNPHAHKIPSELFLKVNPLVVSLVSIASRSILIPVFAFALLITLLTVLFGRFFCGMICPLGALIDFTDRFIFKKMRQRSLRPPVYLQKFKYVLLIMTAVPAAFGILVPVLLDPISILTRIFTILLYPLYGIVASDLILKLKPVFDAAGAESLAYTTVTIPLFYGTAAVLFIVLIIFLGGLWDRRFWCQYLCPTGAFFGLISGVPFFRRTVDKSSCSECRSCIAVCPTRAIRKDDVASTVTGECILCGNCTGIKDGCSHFGFISYTEKNRTGIDFKRRHAVAGIIGGLLALPVYRANAVSKRDQTGRLVRPPGTVPEPEFAARCLACGSCMKACPTNAIQPCSFSDGMQRIYTPKVVPRIGGCEEKCHLCGHVCPTGAIRPLTYEEKRFVKIGTAVVNRHRCLAWEQNKECLVCDEICPYNAISAKVVQTTTGPFKVPVVDEDLCLGCGMCEQHCPVFDKAAIVVYKFGENRRGSGPYVNDWQRKSILEKRKISDGPVMQEHYDSVTSASPAHDKPSDAVSGASAHTPEEVKPKLPPGFITD